MEAVTHLTMAELTAGMDNVRLAPKDHGVLRMIVIRPQEDSRETLQEAELTLADGLVGDNWNKRGSRHMPDRSANPDAQITVMNARAIALLAQTESRWPLAGDQLYVDLDLSDDNLPPGTRLAIGSAVLEVSPVPHTGCKKFSARFGVEAMKFVNTSEGKQLHLRGINTRIVQPGIIHVGDAVRKL
jgi:hypothetical protein